MGGMVQESLLGGKLVHKGFAAASRINKNGNCSLYNGRCVKGGFGFGRSYRYSDIQAKSTCIVYANLTISWHLLKGTAFDSKPLHVLTGLHFLAHTLSFWLPIPIHPANQSSNAEFFAESVVLNSSSSIHGFLRGVFSFLGVSLAYLWSCVISLSL